MTRSARIAKKQEDISIGPPISVVGTKRTIHVAALMSASTQSRHLFTCIAGLMCAGEGPARSAQTRRPVPRAVVPREPKPHDNEIARRHDGYGLAVVT